MYKRSISKKRAYRRVAQAHTGADNVKHINVMLCDEAVEVSVDEGKAWAGTPMAKKTIFNVVKGDLALNEDIVLEEDHGYMRLVVSW